MAKVKAAVKHKLRWGSLCIEDLMNPKPEEIDLPEIDARLRVVRRFSNDPKALFVRQHTRLAVLVAHELKLHPEHLHDEILQWCYDHDDPEAITGDWPGPIKTLLKQHTAIVGILETGLEQAILAAKGQAMPSLEVRHFAHIYDKIAESLEWKYVMGLDWEDWNPAAAREFPAERAEVLIAICRSDIAWNTNSPPPTAQERSLTELQSNTECSADEW